MKRVHGELIIARVNSAEDEINLRPVCAFDGDDGDATWTWRTQGGRCPKSASETATAAAAAASPPAGTQPRCLPTGAAGVLGVVSEPEADFAQRREVSL